MNADLLLIFAFVLAVCLVVFPFAFAIHRRTVEHQERKLEFKARIEEAKASRSNADSEAHRKLEERVRVLERIATDGNHALASQIEQLRDLQELDVISDRRETAR